MAELFQETKGKIRDLPITDKLSDILIAAADEAGVDSVHVTSGGQAKLGTKGKRTGSTRHDLGNAADLMLKKNGRKLDFTNLADQAIFVQFVSAATALGATGIGAGADYMGVYTIHVGFGSQACWGAGGKSATAPNWLRNAFASGLARRGAKAPAAGGTASGGKPGPFVVTARSGLRLRAGPGTNFSSKSVLPSGTRLSARLDSANPEWAQVDLQNDGQADGYVFAAFIAKA